MKSKIKKHNSLASFVYMMTLLFCFSSCKNSNKQQYMLISDFVLSSIKLIGNDIPEDFTQETEYRYSKTIEKSSQTKFKTHIVLYNNSSKIETCTYTFFGSDYLETKQFYDQLLKYFIDEKWIYLYDISKYKQSYGQLHFKNGIYMGIYEPSSFLSIPICFSKEKDLNGFYIKDYEEITEEYVQTFFIMNSEPPKMLYPIDYYKNKIKEYRNFFDERQEISIIIKIDKIIPGSLCFLVCWYDNLRGYIYELYEFDIYQNVLSKYLVGYGPLISNYSKILMEKIPGNKIEHSLISYGDFNNDGINEILSYSLYPNLGYVFTVFGYNVLNNEFIHTCLVPVFINFDNPFPSVESIKNGFRILEVLDSDLLELTWNNYIWDTHTMLYINKLQEFIEKNEK